MIDKLNILFLFTDQIHVFAMGYMDTSDIYILHLDRWWGRAFCLRTPILMLPLSRGLKAIKLS